MCRSSNTGIANALTLAATLLALVGCSQGHFGSELSATPTPHAVRGTSATQVHLPADEPFSIALPSASKEPGLNGTAEADATVDKSGTATASANIAGGGTAQAQFQLGHAFANETGRQADFAFSVRFGYAFEASHEPQVALPDATVGLRLYARDDRGRLLREMIVVEHTTEQGNAQQGGQEQASFTLTLGPGATVNVFLAGQTVIETKDDRSARCTLNVEDLQMELAITPAPPVQNISDEQG